MLTKLCPKDTSKFIDLYLLSCVHYWNVTKYQIESLNVLVINLLFTLPDIHLSWKEPGLGKIFKPRKFISQTGDRLHCDGRESICACVRVSNHLELDYRQLWAAMWLLGIEHSSSGKATNADTCWAIPLAPRSIFKKIIEIISGQGGLKEWRDGDRRAGMDQHWFKFFAIYLIIYFCCTLPWLFWILIVFLHTLHFLWIFSYSFP